MDAVLLGQSLDLAARAISEDRIDDARQILDRILVSEPEHSEARLLLAEAQLAGGDVPGAITRFQELVEVEEVRLRALQGRGISLLLIGDGETGARSLLAAVAEAPDLWRSWNALGAHYDGKQDWAAAEDAYDRALAARQDSALIYNNRGYHHLLRRQVRSAIADFTRALELSPQFKAAELNLRIALAWDGRYESAVAGVQDAEMPEALNNAGYIATLRGDFVDAESLLLRSIEADYGFNRTARRNYHYLEGVRSQSTAPAPDITSIEVE